MCGIRWNSILGVPTFCLKDTEIIIKTLLRLIFSFTDILKAQNEKLDKYKRCINEAKKI
jgi:hypothetical protein